jgi:hypothetical protein
MSQKIIGVTVGTSISPEALKEKLNINSTSGGNTIYYMNHAVEYPEPEPEDGGINITMHSIRKNLLSNSGVGVKNGDMIVASNGTICKVTSVSSTDAGYSPIGTISGVVEGGGTAGKDGYSIFYVDAEVPYPLEEGQSFIVKMSQLSNEGNNIKVGDLAIASNGVLCNVTEIAYNTSKVRLVPIEKIGGNGSGGNADFIVSNTPPDDTSVLWVDPTDNSMAEVTEGSGGIAVTGATVGQTVKISEVDENGVPTAWESVDFPSGGEVQKEWEEFMRFTTDNAETMVFDFSYNGTETLESKKVKEVYIYSPNKANTGCGTASILVNNRVNTTNLIDFGRAGAGCLKLIIISDQNYLGFRYFGRDTDGDINMDFSTSGSAVYKSSENNGVIDAKIPVKNTFLRVTDYKNGIPFYSNPIDYIKTVVVTTAEPCSTGVEFVVYVR